MANSNEPVFPIPTRMIVGCIPGLTQRFMAQSREHRHTQQLRRTCGIKVKRGLAPSFDEPTAAPRHTIVSHSKNCCSLLSNPTSSKDDSTSGSRYFSCRIATPNRRDDTHLIFLFLPLGNTRAITKKRHVLTSGARCRPQLLYLHIRMFSTENLSRRDPSTFRCG